MANKVELSRTDENPKLFFCFPRGSQCISFVTFVQVTTSSMFNISRNVHEKSERSTTNVNRIEAGGTRNTSKSS